MRRAPAFSLIVIVTFALGVGLNTAIFSVVQTVLLKPLPYPDSERLVQLSESTGKAHGISVTWVNFQHWRSSNHTFEEMAAFQFTGQTLTGPAEPLVTHGLAVTSPYFSLLGMHPLLGRLFGAADDRPGAAAVIVLNHRFWVNQFGGDPHIMGTTLTLNGNAYQVAGVAAPVWEPWQVDYYLPLGRILGGSVERGQHGSMRLIGRLRPGISLAVARTDLDTIMRHLAEVDPGPENEHRSFGQFFIDFVSGDVRGTLLLLMAAAVLILLIACANVASLLIARNAARASELAVRKAIGAGGFRLVRQLLTENMVIAILGGAAGVALAYGALRLLLASAPTNLPRLSEITLNVPALLFASGVTLAAGVLAGLLPLIFAGKIDLASALREGSRTSGVNKERQSFRNVLIVGEVALTFVLAFGSGLLLRSLIAAQNTSPGFDPQDVLSFTLQLPGRAYQTPAVASEFYTRLSADLRTIPGVLEVSAVYCPPGAGDCGDWFYSIAGRPVPAQNEVPISLFNNADAGYFKMMRIPIRQGREFNERDRATAPKVAVVNETFARAWWPKESAIGHQIKYGGPYLKGDLLEIVGVAGDVRQFGLDSQPIPEVYQPLAQESNLTRTILIRSAGDPAKLVGTVRRRVLLLDRNLPIQRLGTLEQKLDTGLARRRFSTLLLTLFAGLAMILAAIGIYGLLSYWVASRESEIAIRLALGARRSEIVRLISLHALRLVIVGIAFGALGGWAAGHSLADLVFGIPPRNPATMVAAGLAVVLIALAATAIPAWRAARIDPARRLHSM